MGVVRSRAQGDSGFESDSDAHPSEWFSPDELDEFMPYFETVRRALGAGSRAEEALRRRRVTARDIAGRDRATKAHDEASRERDAADAQRRRLDRAGLGEMRLRIANRLAAPGLRASDRLGHRLTDPPVVRVGPSLVLARHRQTCHTLTSSHWGFSACSPGMRPAMDAVS